MADGLLEKETQEIVGIASLEKEEKNKNKNAYHDHNEEPPPSSPFSFLWYALNNISFLPHSSKITPSSSSVSSPSDSSSFQTKQIKAAKKQCRVFFLSYICYACLYFTRKPFSITKASIQREYNLSKELLGEIDTSFLLMYAIGQFISGILGNFFGAKNFLFFGYFMSAVACFSFGCVGGGSAGTLWKTNEYSALNEEEYTVHTPLLILLWGVNGFVQSGGYPTMTNILYPFFHKNHQGAIMGVWSTCQQMGGMLSTLLPGLLMQRFGWRAAFILPSFAVLSCAFIIIFFLVDCKDSYDNNNDYYSDGKKRCCSDLQEEKEEKEEKAEEEDEYCVINEDHSNNYLVEKNVQKQKSNFGKEVNLKDEKKSFLQVLLLPHILSLGGAYLGVKLVRYVIIMWLPYYLITHVKYTPYAATTIATLFDLGGIIGCAASGYISDRFAGGRRSLVVIPMCVVSALMAFMYSHHSGSGMVVNGIIISTLGAMIAGPDAMLGGVSTADVCNKHNATQSIAAATGIVNGFGSLGVILQGFATSYIVDTFGWGGVFKALSLVAIFPVIILLPSARDEILPKRNKEE